MRDITESLQAVCDKVTGKPSDANLGMHVPANPEQDLDLIAMAAKTEIERLRAIEYAAKRFVDDGSFSGTEKRGYELNGERAYLCDACGFDELEALVSPAPTASD